MTANKKRDYHIGFSERLHQAMDHMGIDRYKRTRKVSDDLGISTSPVSKWFNGHTVPTFKRTKQLCETYNIRVGFLIDGTGPIEATEEASDLNTDLLMNCIMEAEKRLPNLSKDKLAQLTAGLYADSYESGEVNQKSLERIATLLD